MGVRFLVSTWHSETDDDGLIKVVWYFRAA
jgi:hypothetical protein